MGHRILVQGADYSAVAVNADFFVDISNVKSSINKYSDHTGSPIEEQGAIYSNVFTVSPHSIVYLKDTVNYEATILGLSDGSVVRNQRPLQICCFCDNVTNIIVAVKPITEKATALKEYSLSDVVAVIDGSKWDEDTNIDWRKLRGFENRIVNNFGITQSVKTGAILFGFVYLPTGSSITVNKDGYSINITEYSRMILGSETYRVDIQLNATNYTMKGDNFVMFSIKHMDGSTEQITKDMAKSIISINKA